MASAIMVDVLTPPSTVAPCSPLLPGRAAVCDGEVWHRRSRPTVHEFTQDVAYVWLDPDRPDELCAGHPLWSARRPAPARFRRQDYGTDSTGSLVDAARRDVTDALGRRPAGPVRMLTQVRRWGWLFNPITVYLVWDVDTDNDADDPAVAGADPVAAVLEVTNTPWKERHRYPIVLRRDGDHLVSTTDKVLHVSPFLHEGYRYDVRLRHDGVRVELGIDVVAPEADEPIVSTALRVDRRPADRAQLGATLRRRPLSSHRVSAGIHWEALRLWLKRVPFVPHPRKRSSAS